MPPRLTRNVPLALLLLSAAFPAAPGQRLLAEPHDPVAAAASQPAGQTTPPARRTAPAARGVPLEQAILAAEDSRAEDEASLAPLRQGLKADERLQILAVRALGRLERAALVSEIAPMLDSPLVAVRIEAANALGQAVMRGDAGPASVPLTARARTESDARVLAAIARTLGRLPYQQESEIRDAERSILAIADGETTILAGVAHGFDALARRAVKLGSLSAETRARLRTLARHGLGADGKEAAEPAARVRRLAVSALVTARESNVPLLREVMRDPDDQVRRLGVVWLGATEDMPLRDDAFRQAFADTSAMVRYEVLRTYARVRQTSSAAAAAANANRSDDPNRAAASSAGSAARDAGSSADSTSTRASAAAAISAQALGRGECALEVKALDDASANVGLLAIDSLGRCGERDAALERLMPIVAELGEAPRAGRAPGGAAPGASQSGAQSWHRPAHALVAIARLAPDRAAAPLARAAAHEVWQVRMYAARAAGVLKDRATLDALAADGEDNVREAAIEALQALVGHEADGQYLAALERSDPQLLRTAARALDGTSQKGETASRVLKAFARASAARRETSRDVRLALLDTLESVSRTPGAPPQDVASGSAPDARAGAQDAARRTAPVENAIEMLRPYLADFDPLVARRVAAILTAWTDQSHVAAPTRLPAVAVPSPREIERMARTRAVVRMARGGTFTLALRPDVAPTNAARFVRLARAGTFNGLTFHRVEPNFVLQGGSPGANEFAGDGPFTRDELDLTSNLRGTVGVSTRGRDTGDGQLYVNLVDNVRLDHNYTVFAEIVEGLPAIEEILEGDVIARIELRERP